MKNLFIYLFLLCLIISVNAENLTNEQLIQIVKKFENNQNLQNLKVDLKEETVELVTNTENKHWTIKDGEVIMYINFNLGNFSDPFHKTDTQFSIQQYKNIAVNYLNSKNISLVDYFNVPIVEYYYGCYDIDYVKFIDQELNLLSNKYIEVSVDAVTGQIASYLIHKAPEFTLINRPNLSDAQVIQIIQSYFGNISEDSIIIGKYVLNNDSTSIEKIVQVGNIGLATIDAYTHEIVEFNPYGGTNVNLLKPIIPLKENKSNINIISKAIDNEKNIDISNVILKNTTINFILCDTENPKDVKYTDISTEFEIDKGIARMEVNGNKFIFRNGSYWCFINNKTYNMDGNCIIKDGKLQLPEDFYKKVQTKDYDFFSKSQKQLIK